MRLGSALLVVLCGAVVIPCVLLSCTDPNGSGTGPIVSPPVITGQPTSQLAVEGDTVVFAVFAGGSAQLDYQWQRNGIDIPGATAETYTIAPVRMADSGCSFRCIVTNHAGGDTSNAATLMVVRPPAIVRQPSNLLLAEGDDATFSVGVVGTPPLYYQWYRNGAAIAGGDSSHYTVSSVSRDDDGATFHCRITGYGNETVVSSQAVLNVGLAFDTLPDKVFTFAMGPLTLTGQHVHELAAPFTAGIGTHGPFSVALDGVAHIRFSQSSPSLRIDLGNASSSVLSNVVVTLGGVGHSEAVTVPASGSATTDITMAGTAVWDSLGVQVSLEATAAGTLSISFSFAGLLADSAVVADSLIQDESSFILDYALTSSLDIDYVDFIEGAITYTAENHTGTDVFLIASHHSFWHGQYCSDRDLTSVSDLAADGLDSTYYEGVLAQAYVPLGAGTAQTILTKNVSRLRLFPEWDDTQARSETYIECIVKAPFSTGQTVTRSARDSLVFVVQPRFIRTEPAVGTWLR